MADDVQIRSRRFRWFRRLTVAAVTAAFLVAGGLFWFQPWKLWTTSVVDEALPILVAAASTVPAAPSVPVVPEVVPPASSLHSEPAAAVPRARPVRTTSARAAPPTPATRSAGSPAGPTTPAPTVGRTGTAAATPGVATLLATGELISHEHETSGSIQVIRLADGHRVLALKNLRTSDGPSVHVWLTDAPVISGSDGWHVFDDGAHLDLGGLKGNVGNQVYPIGDDVTLSKYSSVAIWCDRFSVSFGAAQIVAVRAPSN